MENNTKMSKERTPRKNKKERQKYLDRILDSLIKCPNQKMKFIQLSFKSHE